MGSRASTGSQTLRPEGGFVALVGYLMQILGGAQDYVACLTARKDEPADGGFQTLLSFEHEAHGQDFAAVAGTPTGGLTRTLTQYKFSLQPNKYTITPNELEEITKALRQGEEAANRGDRLPTRFVLRTNRPLSPESRKAFDSAKAGEPSTLLTTKTVREQVAGKRVTRRVARDPDFGRVLAVLDYQHFDPDRARRELEDYARRFGVYQTDELDRGVDRVISLLFGAATSYGSKQVRREDFEQSLVGFRAPRQLTTEALAPLLSAELARQRRQVLGVEPPRFLVPRSAARDLAGRAEEALVVIIGDGGCGKSVVLWEAVQAAVQAAGPARRLASLITGAGADTGNGLATLVAAWRTKEDAPPGTDSDDVAVQRLIRANPGVDPPILVLGLDGVDEVPYDQSWRHRAGRLIRYFWELHQNPRGVPPARLYVTCRSRGDVEPFIGSRGGHGVVGRPIRYVTVGEFSDGELAVVCRRTAGVDPGVADTLLRAIAARTPGPYDAGAVADDPYSPEPLGFTAVAGAALGAALDALRVIRHPILWHHFSEMSQSEQAALLGGAPHALDGLADRYLDWFARRAQSRRDFTPADVRIVLGAVAKRCANPEVSYEPSDWNVPARDASGWGDVFVRKLFHEAVSSGMIDEIPSAGGGSGKAPGSWRWRHPFVAGRLAET